MRYHEISDDRLARAKAMGFNTDVVVYHGSRSQPFDAFDSGRLGAYTGSPSAKLGFFFGSSRENSVSYAAVDPLDDTKEKNLPARDEIIKAIKERCAEEGLPKGFSMGVSSGSAFPKLLGITQITDDTHQIKAAITRSINQSFRDSLQRAQDYIEGYARGEFKPKRDYSSVEFVNQQVALLTRQRDIALSVVEDWKEPLATQDWGFIGAYFLKMSNPLVVDQNNGGRVRSFAEIIAEAKQAGHDGVVILNTFDPKPTDVYVVFEANQIRSVEATFNPREAHSDNLMA